MDRTDGGQRRLVLALPTYLVGRRHQPTQKHKIVYLESSPLSWILYSEFVEHNLNILFARSHRRRYTCQCILRNPADPLWLCSAI